ncbi:MAG: translation initiation factor IF-2 [Thermoguttaceae bacterium]
MPIRVFNLAKELKQENKVITDVIRELKLRDSDVIALTTLTDDEANLVRARLSHNLSSKAVPSKSLAEASREMPLEPPKISRPSLGKIRQILPATGRISKLDSSKKVSPTTNGLKNGQFPQVAVHESENVAVIPSLVGNVDSSVGDSKPVLDPVDVQTIAQEVPNPATTVSDNNSLVEQPCSSEENSLKDVSQLTTEKVSVEAEKPATTVSVEQFEADELHERVERTIISDNKSEPVNDVTPEIKKGETSCKVVSPETDTVKKTPLRQVMENRNSRGDSQKKGRDRDVRRAQRVSEPKPVKNDNRTSRPAPIASSFITQLESRAQILDEMKRPPMITVQSNDRVRVLGVNQSKQKQENNASAHVRSASKPNLSFHFAPMPAEPVRPLKKVAKEPEAQKPEKRLSPEAFKGLTGAGPLSKKLRAQKELGNSSPVQLSSASSRSEKRAAISTKDSTDRSSRGTRDASRPPRMDQMFGSNLGTSQDFSASRFSKKRGKDRDEEAREDTRGNVRRRQGNESKRFRSGEDDTFDSHYTTRSGGRSKRDKNVSGAVSTAPRKSDIVIDFPCTPKEFAESTGLSVAVVIKKLLEFGCMATINQSLDRDVVELLIEAFELKATIKQAATLEEQYVDSVFDMEDPPESLKPRAPVVTFLGHVDHGKTSLLDRILNLHVVSGEKGGITQHIRAYRVETPGGPVTFVDTPGHEAFTEMRARGANVTDVAVLVVAADDGVMPQTEEAISHVRAAGVPIVVALNKMDLPHVNRDKVIQELAANDLMPSEWGGDVEIIDTSALTGMGVDNLLNTLLMVAELHDLKANPDRPATGVVLESSRQSGEGVVATALVQKGTLKNGDVVLCGSTYGRVRSMADTLVPRKRIKEAGPGVPVKLTGLNEAPNAGSRFVVLGDVAIARQIAEERAKQAHAVELAGAVTHVTLENLFDRLSSSKMQKNLNVIIRADVRGSIEAIRKELGKLEHPEVKVKILQASVGGITEADVHLADASDAIIVGFNVVPDEGARALAESKRVQIRRYDIIYKLSEDIRAALEGMLKPEEHIKELGRALVQRVFNITHVGSIAGCRVLSGVIERDSQVRVARGGKIIGEYKLETLKREKDEVKEVREGFECGIKLKSFNDVHEGDILEAYKIEEVARTL